jgi:hypothetical protein
VTRGRRRRSAAQIMRAEEARRRNTDAAVGLDPYVRRQTGPRLDGLTDAELAFARKAGARGWKVYRNGWPDFLCTDPDTDATFFVEVKAETDSIRIEQETLFAALELAGITVRIFTPGVSNLVHWRTYAYPGASDRGAGRSKFLLSRRLASIVLADEEARAGARDAAGTVALPGGQR